MNTFTARLDGLFNEKYLIIILFDYYADVFVNLTCDKDAEFIMTLGSLTRLVINWQKGIETNEIAGVKYNDGITTYETLFIVKMSAQHAFKKGIYIIHICTDASEL